MGGWLIMTEGRCSKPQPTTTAVIKTRSSRMCSRVIADGWGDQASTSYKGYLVSCKHVIWGALSKSGVWIPCVRYNKGQLWGDREEKNSYSSSFAIYGRKEDDPRRRFDTAGANERERSFCPLHVLPFPPHASCDATPKNGLDLILIWVRVLITFKYNTKSRLTNYC